MQHPGTYAGLAEKIDELKTLGITAVELLPVDEFDENDCPFVNPLTGEKLRNFWGYNPIALLRSQGGLCQQSRAIGPVARVLRRWSTRFTRPGIEVYLDVVFNHTAEGGEDGPTYSFRGVDNTLFYMLDEQGRYLNFSGCGNTFSSDHPVVRNFLLDCLRNWVAEGAIDGFRFDLASVLGRDRHGNVLVEPPVVKRISEDSLLRDTKLIAEPWDAAGLYQVGTFPGEGRWSDWNGRYRDDVRRFWRGDPGMTSALATRLCGSDDLYEGRGPLAFDQLSSAATTGSRCNDLVSYNHKHNEANGEGNRDGSDANWSWNCGVEGPTERSEVLAIRGRQVRNLMATLMISQGVPMILGGDEFLRTQHGNNNAWCQDNPISWVDWSLHGAERRVPAVRPDDDRPAEGASRSCGAGRFSRANAAGMPPEIVWHGIEPAKPDFSYDSRSLAFALDGRRSDRPNVVDRDIYVADERLDRSRSDSRSRPRRRAAPGAARSIRRSLRPRISWRKTAGPRVRFCRSIACRPTR